MYNAPQFDGSVAHGELQVKEAKIERRYMINIAELEFATPSIAPPGSLLIHAAKSPNHAAMLMLGGGVPRNALTIDNSKRPFRIVNAHVGHGPFLRVAKPRFVVDLSSALNGFDSSPDLGTLFLAPSGMGIVAIADHIEVGAMLDGTLMPGIDYGTFAGFCHWRIEVGDPTEPQVLFTYRHASLDAKA